MNKTEVDLIYKTCSNKNELWRIKTMRLVYEVPTAEDYVSLPLRSGMGNKNLERSQTALKNSSFTVSL